MYTGVYKRGCNDIGYLGSLFGLRLLGFGLDWLREVGFNIFKEVLYLKGSAEYTFPEYEVVLTLKGGDDDLVVFYLNGLALAD